MKPNVRARLISFRKEVVEKSIDARCAMPVEDRVLEIDLEVDAEAVVRLEAHPLVAVLDLDALAHADEALRRVLLLDAGRLQQEHERRGAAVHDRHFGRGQVDEALSMPRPAIADIRCSTVPTFGRRPR